MTLIECDPQAFLEKLASLSHEQWSGWMHWLFKFGTQNPDGTFTISAEKVERWRRQMNTKYEDLPPEEQDSDRDEAVKVLQHLAGVHIPTIWLEMCCPAEGEVTTTESTDVSWVEMAE